MTLVRFRTALATGLIAALAAAGTSPAQEVREERLAGTRGVELAVRMEGPYTADVPLQVVCYFKHRPEGDVTKGAAIELDERLGGVVAALRDRGEFAGEPLETVLLTPPAGSIKARRLLLIGLGDEASLTVGRMEAVGRVALREAARLGVDRAAFAPLLRDQGDDRLAVGEVERAVVGGVLSAYETEKRLQEQGLAPAWDLERWQVEAGPAFFDETVVGVRRAIDEVKAAVASRDARPYRKAD